MRNLHLVQQRLIKELHLISIVHIVDQLLLALFLLLLLLVLVVILPPIRRVDRVLLHVSGLASHLDRARETGKPSKSHSRSARFSGPMNYRLWVISTEQRRSSVSVLASATTRLRSSAR